MVLSTFRLLQPETYDYRNAVAAAIANKRTVSNNNIFYSMSFINRIIIMIIVYDYY